MKSYLLNHIVIGSRFLSETENVPSYRKLGINVITKLTNASIKKNLTDSQQNYYSVWIGNKM